MSVNHLRVGVANDSRRKFSPSQEEIIRSMYSSGRSVIDIANELGVYKGTISEIVHPELRDKRNARVKKMVEFVHTLRSI